MVDESKLPIEEQSLVYRLRTRAAIRKQATSRKSVQEGKPDRLALLLEEAADEIEYLRREIITKDRYTKELERAVETLNK